jgi:hypothetical protein
MVEAKLLRKKLKNGLIVDKWDLVTIIEKQQAEITALKERLRPCNPLCKPSVCDCRPLNQTYDPKKHGAEE